MANGSVIRNIDKLGRIVIPAEIRKILDLKEYDWLTVLTEDDKIILRKYEFHCTFCTETNDLIEYNEKKVCKNCAKNIKELTNKLP